MAAKHNLAAITSFETIVTKASWIPEIQKWRLVVRKVPKQEQEQEQEGGKAASTAPATATATTGAQSEELNQDDQETKVVQKEKEEEDEVILARFCVMGVGQLSKPAYPHIEGRETFAGKSTHTARWDLDMEKDIKGKKVAVVGTGRCEFCLFFSITIPLHIHYIYDITLCKKTSTILNHQ